VRKSILYSSLVPIDTSSQRRCNMNERVSTFRDFGVLPTADLEPPAAVVRCFLSLGRLIGQYIFSGIVAAVGIGLLALFAVVLPAPQSIVGGVAALLAFSAILCLATHNDYRWVELEGNTLRAKHAYTGRIVERTINEIDGLGTIVRQVRQRSTPIMERLLGRVKGIEIRFRDGRTPLRIHRADPAMTNAEELMKAVIFRMSQIDELEPEVVDFQGRPLVRAIHWKGKEPQRPPSKGMKAILACFTLLALLFGGIFGFWGSQERERFQIGSLPAQRITLASLIKNGPGSNRHVIITDCRPGGYVVESEHDSWREITVAIFQNAVADNQISAVVALRGVQNEAQLGQRLTQPITGVCSAEPRTSWGVTLGPKLVEANRGRSLGPAWWIEEMREPPSEVKVDALLTGSLACFVAVWVLAGLTISMAVR
jgi:hypothetical protein